MHLGTNSNCLKWICFLCLLLFFQTMRADTFSNLVARADIAKKRGDLQLAKTIYDRARTLGNREAGDMCALSRCYCDLAYLTASIPVQKDLVARALSCAQQAVAEEPTNATAHASLAVCYAKSCSYVDIKTQLEDSRIFKDEAEKAIALDPNEDTAWYLLGRWNDAISRVGFFSRAYVRVVYGALPHASIRDAIADFKKACQLAPNRILNHAGLANAYDAAGEKNLEIAELQKCCAMQPLAPEDQDALKEAKKKLAALQP